MGTKNKTDDRIVGSSTTSRTPIARQAFNSPFDPGFHFEEQVRCFRDMLENVQFIAVSIDMKGRVTFCNNYLLELTGWKRSEVIGEDWFERFISEESIDHLRELFLGDHSLEHLPCHYENDILTRDGRSFSIHFNNGILRNGAGAPIGLMSFGEDVTERKRTEDALEAEREKLRLLYENNPDAIVVMDPDLKIIYANKRVEDVTSLPIDAIKGKRCFEAIIGRKTVCKGCQVHEVLEHREPRERVKHEKTSGGKENWLQQLLYPIVDKNGNVESIVEIARDITADKKILEAHAGSAA
ncbi:MAG: PAS domain-containing protein, partial [Chloroflexi bacterium]|nr:PAS domain-containing protein [Chloroflexota bacterium]